MSAVVTQADREAAAALSYFSVNIANGMAGLHAVPLTPPRSSMDWRLVMDKPTPGPWVCEPSPYHDLAYHLTDADGNILTFRDEEHEANALLIASAPELLEACEAVVNHLAIEGSSLQLLIRAAIAKATGAQS